jgi:hypothetical protein
MMYSLSYLSKSCHVDQTTFDHPLITSEELKRVIDMLPRAIYFKDVAPLDIEGALQLAREREVALYVTTSYLISDWATSYNLLQLKAELLRE